MKRKRQKGFTLIELLVATLAGAIVVAAAGTSLHIGHTSWNRGWKKANLQREASYIMLRMSRPIRAGATAQLDADGRALMIYTEGGQMSFHAMAVPEAGYLTLMEGDAVTSIDGKLHDLQFNLEGSKVTINLTLKEGDVQTHCVSTVMMRNYGG